MLKGELIDTLRVLPDAELDNIINEIKEIKEARKQDKADEYLVKLHDLFSDMVRDGFSELKFDYMLWDNDSLKLTFNRYTEFRSLK